MAERMPRGSRGPTAVRHADPTVVRDQDENGEPSPDQDMYGLRVVWQSEEEKLEAAEFLVATRVQRDETLRVLHDARASREHPEPSADGATAPTRN